jgi:hypothetical protein
MDAFLTTEALRTTECIEKNSKISVFQWFSVPQWFRKPVVMTYTRIHSRRGAGSGAKDRTANHETHEKTPVPR